MNWTSLLLAITTMSPVEAMLTTVIFGYLISKGIIQIPSLIKKKKLKKEKSEQPESLMSMHESCPNFTSITVILERVMEKSDRIFRIKYNETLYEQMNDAELMWVDTKDVLKDNFIKTFDEENKDDATKDEKLLAINYYTMVIDNMEVEMLGLIRRWMRKNHFIEKTELEYQAYIEEKIEQLYNKMSRLFNERYDEDVSLVDRKILRNNMNTRSMPIISKRVQKFFLRAKAVAIEKLEKIKKIEEEIHTI